MLTSGSRPSSQSFLYLSVLIARGAFMGGAILHTLEKTREARPHMVPSWGGELFYIRWRSQGKRGHHLCGCKEASVRAACRLASVAALVSPQAPVSNLSPMLYKPARLPQRFSREAFGLLEC